MKISNTKWPRLTVEKLQANQRYALNGGPFGSNLVSRMYVEVGVPVIRGVNLPMDKRFSLEGLVFVTEEKAEELSANTASPGDVVFTQRGTLGQVGIIPKTAPFEKFVISQSQMKLTTNPEVADADFIYYTFRHPETVSRITSLTSSSGVPHINLDTLRNFEIDVPPIGTQRRIASILSTYDDLIENNTRRIEILEEMVRRLYEEWFVRFRFPGHEEVSFVESKFGPVPEGWEIKPLGSLAIDSRETVHPSNVPGDTPYVGLEHLPRRSITLTSWATADTVSSNKLRFLRGDILFGKIRPYFHKVVVAPIDGICSTDTILLRVTDEKYSCIALCCTSSDDFVQHATQTSNGTKMPRANWNILKDYLVAIPNNSMLDIFNRSVQDMINLTNTLMFKNANLRTQRDLLLPKLISGQIDVSEAEEMTKEAAA